MDLISLQYPPEPMHTEEEAQPENIEEIKDYKVKSNFTKNNIVLSLEPAPTAAVASTIDDNAGTGKDLWEEIKKLYTMSNTQLIMNLTQQLDNLKLHHESCFNQHMNQVLDLVDQLASFGHVIEEY